MADDSSTTGDQEAPVPPAEEGLADTAPQGESPPASLEEPSEAEQSTGTGQPTPSQVEFVGGPTVRQRRGIFSRRLTVVAGLILAGAILVAAGWFASQLLPEALAGVFGSDGREPRTTHLFTQALAHHDPAGMRAQVTSKCVADQNSSLCFGPEFDNQFRIFVKDRTLTPTFLRQFKGHTGRFVVYDLYMRLSTTGQQDEIMLTFRLANNGKIDQVLTS